MRKVCPFRKLSNIGYGYISRNQGSHIVIPSKLPFLLHGCIRRPLKLAPASCRRCLWIGCKMHWTLSLSMTNSTSFSPLARESYHEPANSPARESVALLMFRVNTLNCCFSRRSIIWTIDEKLDEVSRRMFAMLVCRAEREVVCWARLGCVKSMKLQTSLSEKTMELIGALGKRVSLINGRIRDFTSEWHQNNLA